MKIFLSLILVQFIFAIDAYESLALNNSEIYQSIKDHRDIKIRSLSKKHIKPIRYYRKIYQEGLRLTETCKKKHSITYQDQWIREQVVNSLVATLQLKIIDMSLSNIPYYAKKLNFSDDDFQSLSNKMTKSMCSKNISVISHRRIRYLLNKRFTADIEELHKNYQGFKDFDNKLIDEEIFKRISREKLYLKKLETALYMFKSACTWGQDYTSPRLLSDYISNPTVMAEIIKSMNSDKIDVEKYFKNMVTKKDFNSTKVLCDGIICRNTSYTKFVSKFPLSLGSRGLIDDLEGLFCTELKTGKTEPELRLTDSVKEMLQTKDQTKINHGVNYFLSSLSGTPVFNLWPSSEREYRDLVESSIDSFWNTWSRKHIKKYTNEASYEEMITLRATEKDYYYDSYFFKTQINLALSSGEFDEVFNRSNKLQMKSSFFLPKRDLIYLHKNYLANWPSNKEKLNQLDILLMGYIENGIDDTDKFINKYLLDVSIKKLVLNDFKEKLMARDKLRFQDGKKNPTRKIEIPVNLNIGNFALIYLKNRFLMLNGLKNELRKESLYNSGERVDTMEMND